MCMHSFFRLVSHLIGLLLIYVSCCDVIIENSSVDEIARHGKEARSFCKQTGSESYPTRILS